MQHRRVFRHRQMAAIQCCFETWSCIPNKIRTTTYSIHHVHVQEPSRKSQEMINNKEHVRRSQSKWASILNEQIILFGSKEHIMRWAACLRLAMMRCCDDLLEYNPPRPNMSSRMHALLPAAIGWHGEGDGQGTQAQKISQANYADRVRGRWCLNEHCKCTLFVSSQSPTQHWK